MENCILVLLVFAVVGGLTNGYDTAKLIESEGYFTETHHVTTSDGYILQVDRIPYGRYQSSSHGQKRPVVFCMHGLLAGSDSYFALGAEKSLAFNLADAGFDVWLGNARGNRYSRQHVKLNPDKTLQKYDFFDFSWEEIGMIDVPAMIDYALQHTGREKLHYIGHSQGGTAFLVMGSMRPEYNDKMESVHLLAGVGYMKHFPNSNLAGIAAMTDVIYNFARSIGMVELFPPSSDARSGARSGVTTASCAGDARYDYMCTVVGADEITRGLGSKAQSSIAGGIFDSYEPAGASMKQIAHYGQNIRDHTFRRWNYGLLQNLVKYKSSYPPAYDLSKITADVTMHYTISDALLDEKDVLAMAEVIPNCKVRKVARDDFKHEDFIAALDAKELVTDYVIGKLKEASK